MFDIQEELKKLPDRPGVYIMKDKNEKIIYIGKAVILKNRVRQYFQNTNRHPAKVRAMVARVAEFEYIVTDTELEALILECNLIKKHRPKYNILLKDDKAYPYIKVTLNEDYPRVLMARKLEKDGAKYFGPYTSVFAVKETIDLIKKLFPIKTCSRVLPRDIGKERPCLNFHIYQCLGPCRGDVNKDEYRALMKDICSFLEGRHDEITRRLEQDMRKAAEAMDYERAAKIRDKLLSLKHISEKQKVLSTAMEDEDVIAFAKGRTDSCVEVFFIRGGKLIGREHFILEGTEDIINSELLTSFLKQFYSSASYIPPQILMQDDIDELNIIEQWLSARREGRVHIRVPRKGEKQHLIEMVSQNAAIALAQFSERLKNEKGTAREGLDGLMELLGLGEAPSRIEAYDISNTGTSEMVASMVVFEDGMPARRDYRRFKIKGAHGQDDYASMQEVIFRRFKHAEREWAEYEKSHDSTVSMSEHEMDGKFNKLPDLLLIDGGSGHVNSVMEVMRELKIDIPVCGMVKDEHHRTRGLITDCREFELRENLTVHRFVTSIQDEAHRFALEYNRKLREKRYRKSVLDDIEGIGPQRKKALIKQFGSIAGIKSAELDDLQKVKGISRANAEKIYGFFHK